MNEYDIGKDLRKVNEGLGFDPGLERRLDEWGNFLIDLKNNRLGYPRQSPLVAVIEVGIFCPNFGPREPYLNERAMEVAVLVNQLNLRFPFYAQALQAYYVYPNLPRRVIAESMKISIGTLKARVHAAKVWLSDRLV